MMSKHDDPLPLQCSEPDSLPIKKCFSKRKHLAQVICQNAKEING